MTPSAGAPLLVVDGLRKRYRRTIVLDGVSLVLRPGEAVALLGGNGAGKSTLLGCITGDRLPDAGSIRLCGHDPFQTPRAAAGCMGYVPEQPFLYGELTLGELLQFVAAARALPAERALAERTRLLELLGLAGSEDVLCRELSQGMARKAVLAAALLHGPGVILLDEALNGVDRPSAERVVRELDARRRAGAAVLLASHDLDFVARWCERGVLLGESGRWTSLEGAGWERWRGEPSLTQADRNGG
jgi:ABC-2 type transport system ATP-binding protein